MKDRIKELCHALFAEYIPQNVSVIVDMQAAMSGRATVQQVENIHHDIFKKPELDYYRVEFEKILYSGNN